MALSRKRFLELTITTVGALVGGCDAATSRGGDGAGGDGGETGEGGSGGGGAERATVSDGATGVGGADGASGVTSGAPTCAALDTVIELNHGHTLVVPFDDLSSTVDKEYDIRGSANHTHRVILTAAHFALLRSGQEVRVDSSLVCCSSANKHAIVLSC